MTTLTLLDGVGWRGAAVPGERGHALLATLALAAPRAVGVAELIDQVWTQDVPDHPEKALQVLVSRTRSRTTAEAITHVGTGYRLGLRDDEVDALRLRQLVAAARAARAEGDLDVARLAARDALAVTVTTPARDGALGDLVHAATRDRAAAQRLLGQVLLVRGDAAEALPLLEAALGEDPTDEERLEEVLRAESSVRGVPAALARYASYVDGVRETLGAEPGESLRRLHADLLARDAPVREGLKYDAAPMVGRDDDVARIRGLLEGARVVSVVGAGGLGKTRMAHLVGRLAHQPVVHFVELAGVNAAEGVLPEVASALGVRESVASTRTAQLRSDLRSRVAQQLSGPPTLLILDNCEHLVEAVADLVAFLVATTDATRVLTTSRAPLGIAAEQVYLLPQLGDDDAVELFGQRARAARSDVRLDGDEVRGLVGRLDGLPLAIELAAAKVRVMAVAEIARRLGDRFALLVGGDRSAPDRHHTLEAVIDWSWKLLREEDQAALRTLSVFPDGFSLAGAEVMLGRDPLPAIAELADQSLLVVREGEQMRYRFLETVREYGLKQLAAVDGVDAARARLRGWAVVLARELYARLYTPDQVAAMHAIRAEAGNLAGVMRTALDHRDAVTVVPLVAVLSGFWMIEGDHLTVLALAEPVLDVLLEPYDVDPAQQDELRAVLALMVTNASIFAGQTPVHAIERLRELGTSGDGTRADAMCHVMLGVYGTEGPELDALQALTGHPDPAVARLALMWSTQALENAGDLAGALDSGRRALALCDDSEGPWNRALIEAMLCGMATQFGDWDLCVRHGSRALPVMEELGAVEDVLQLRSVLALADLSQGRLDRAEKAINEIARDERSEQIIGWSVGRVGQAELALARGEVERGLAIYRDCIDIARNRRMPGLAVDVVTTPWLLFAESSALFAHVAHGAREESRDLADVLRGKLVTVLDPTALRLDYPVAGCVLLAVGAWDLVDGEDRVSRRTAVRMIALAERFGYQRMLPTMGWANVVAMAENLAPGLLAESLEEYAGRPPAGLREDALALARG